jgi:hypothetical protein
MTLTTKFTILAIGVATAGLTTLLEAVSGAKTPEAMGWALAAGMFGAGTTWGLTKGAISSAKASAASAHARVSEEKRDRERSVDTLRGEVRSGFERVDRALDTQTKTILAAVTRDGNLTRSGD